MVEKRLFSLHIPWYLLFGYTDGCYQPETSFRWESYTVAFMTVWPGGPGSVLVGDVWVL